jgi:beta-phosphoglucomutase-like phosphatase (HAD superfamily)
MKHMLPQNPKSYFLDFDGVVIESTDIKTNAFYEIYLTCGADIAEKARSF